MQKENRNSSTGSYKTNLSLKMALAVLIVGTFSLECRAGWTSSSSPDVSVSIDQTNSSSINSSTNGASTSISLSTEYDGYAEWGGWITASSATASGSGGDSGVSVSVSQNAHCEIWAEDSCGFSAGANVVSSASSSYSWDGPPSGPQGTAAEPVSVHLSIDCEADSGQWADCHAAVNSLSSRAQGSGTGGTTAFIGISSDGGADDINFQPVANTTGMADSSPSATGAALADPGQTGGTGPDSYTPYTELDIYPDDGSESTEASYSIQLEEDAELNQGSVSFEATVEVNSESGAHLEFDKEEHLGPVGSGGGSGLGGSASVTISGIILH